MSKIVNPLIFSYNPLITNLNGEKRIKEEYSEEDLEVQQIFERAKLEKQNGLITKTFDIAYKNGFITYFSIGSFNPNHNSSDIEICSSPIQRRFDLMRKNKQDLKKINARVEEAKNSGFKQNKEGIAININEVNPDYCDLYYTVTFIKTV